MTFAFPSSAFAAPNGDIVVTEQNPAWVDILTKNQNLVSAVQLTGFSSPAGANEYEPNHVIVVDRTHPGKIVEFDFSSSSNTLVPAWRYQPSKGAGELNHPSLAIVLSNGDVMVADSGNDRVVVIDPADDRVIWQYGHTHRSGTGPGYLHTPDSVALVPNKPPG
jgi:outer membrane protein assembly factor BamB